MVQQNYSAQMTSYNTTPQYETPPQQLVTTSLRHQPTTQMNSNSSINTNQNNNINNFFKQLIMPANMAAPNQTAQHIQQSNQHRQQQQLTYQNQNLYQQQQSSLQQPTYSQQQSSSLSNFNNLAQYTTLSNVNFNNSSNVSNSMGILSRNSNLLRGSYDNLENFKSIKANKINSDGDNSSKIYGNALLGSNIWDKNDAFQGEKFGPKFEYLEIDEFLNENGLNESDVEFLDQLQKTDANNTETNNNNKTSSAQLSNLLTLSTSLSSANSISSSSSTTSPSSSNSSTSTGLDSSRPSSSINLNQTSIVQPSSQQQNSFLNNSQTVRNNTVRPLEQQQPLSFSNITKSLPNKSKETNLNENLISSTSSTGSPRASTSSRLNSFDWSVNDDNDDLDDIDDLEEYTNRMRKYTAEELKLQPSLKKSKKNNMMSMNDYSCVSSYNNSVNNYNSQFSNDMLLSDSELSLTEFDDTEVSSSQHSTSKGNRKHQFVPNELKDDKYWARRRKNNMAAKRSRDARRMKENQIAITASYLERENDLLRKQLEDSKRETKLLKAKLARYESMNPMEGSK